MPEGPSIILVKEAVNNLQEKKLLLLAAIG
jgi:hypothetical protein